MRDEDIEGEDNVLNVQDLIDDRVCSTQLP